MPDQQFDFYGWILPEGNNYYAAYTRLTPDKPNPRSKDGRWINHAVFNTLPALEAWADGRSESTEASYFALAAFTANGPSRKDKFGREWPVAVRKQENVQAIKSLWVDIDCGGPDKQYLTKGDALAAVNAAVDAGDILPPSITVDSGNGYHLYWCMEKGIPEKVWKAHALRFRNHIAAIGLRIDGGCTIDSARILRCPGTLNCKDASNPKDVIITEYSDTYVWDTFMAALQPMENATGDDLDGTLDISQLAPLAAAAAAADNAANSDLAAGLSPTSQSELAVVATKCHQIGEMLSNGGATCDEPLWKAMLLLAGACADGEAMAHTLSSGHKDYDRQRTQAKFEEQRAKLADATAGPSRCSSFFNLRPEGCAGCPNNDLRIAERPGYPWRLGFNTERLGFLPSGFRETPDMGLERLVIEQDEDGNTIKSWVRFADFVVRDFTMSRIGQEKVCTFSTVRRGQGAIRGDLMTSALYGTPVAANGGLTKAGITISNPKEAAHMVVMLKSFADELEKAVGVPMQAVTLAGYIDATTFRLGRREITAKGVTATTFSAPNETSLAAALEPKGTYAEWSKVRAPIAAASPAIQTIVAVAFGSVLAKLINFNGFLFSFYSRESGTGKTTAIAVGASIFGDPSALVASFNDTEKSVAFRMGARPNLPAYWDEVRSVASDKEMAGRVTMLFSLAQGKERTRLTQDIQVRDGGTWNTLMGIGTNEHLSDMAASSKDAPDPITARMLEIAMPNNLDTSIAASKPFSVIHDNYGWAAEPFIQKVLTDRDALITAIEAMSDKIRVDTGLLDSSFRFKHRACALVIVGAAIAKQLDIFDFDLQGIKELLIRSMTTADKTDRIVASTIKDTTGTFFGWFTESPGAWLLMEGRKLIMNPNPLIGATYHVDVSTHQVWMKWSGFRNRCRKEGLSPSGVIDNSGGRLAYVTVPFGDGSPYGGATGVLCVVFDGAANNLKPAIDAYKVDSLAVANGGRYPAGATSTP
jgi:Domain of unknown function (DUF927)